MRVWRCKLQARNVAPTLAHCVWLPAPQGGATRLGAARRRVLMLPLTDWPSDERRLIRGVFTDIDDTLTTEGQITPDALNALAQLQAAGLTVIAITGRPVGWCAPFAASWPVHAIVAENGAVALVPSLLAEENASQPSPKLHKPLSKLYQQDAATRASNRLRMQAVGERVMREVPGVGLTQDSAGRETDLAFDYNEFVNVPPDTVQRVLDVLVQEGMQTTVSSIHIHGCFGHFDKWLGACWIGHQLLQRDIAHELDRWVFVGDSGNDQAMFEHFTHSVGVANIRRFESQLSHLPRYIAHGERGAGFAEVARAVLQHDKAKQQRHE